MARITHDEEAGLDLLDRLYCSHILVHQVFNEGERDWLQRISLEVQAAAVSRLPPTCPPEVITRVTHWALCMLEFWLANDATDFAEVLKLPPMEEIEPEKYERLREHELHSHLATMTVFGDMAGDLEEDPIQVGSTAVSIAAQLHEGYKEAPSTVRFRLVENVLAMDYPTLPIVAFRWLADSGVVRPSKFNTIPREYETEERVALVRAASLCELEILRSYISTNTLLAIEPSHITDVFLDRFSDDISDAAQDVLVDTQARQLKRSGMSTTKRTFMAVKTSWLFRPGYVQSFFEDAYQLAPHARFAMNKKSTALTDIGASLIGLPLAGCGPKALFKNDEDSRATKAAETLAQHGFSVHPRTLYTRFKTSHKAHKELIKNVYYESLLHFGLAFPPLVGNTPHLVLCAAGSRS